MYNQPCYNNEIADGDGANKTKSYNFILPVCIALAMDFGHDVLVVVVAQCP
jgi:hypothetical protein